MAYLSLLLRASCAECACCAQTAALQVYRTLLPWHDSTELRSTRLTDGHQTRPDRPIDRCPSSTPCCLNATCSLCRACAIGIDWPWRSDRRAPWRTKERHLRSKIRWFAGFCNSHYISQLAAFFIDARAKRSTVGSCCFVLSLATHTHTQHTARRDRRTSERTSVSSGACVRACNNNCMI